MLLDLLAYLWFKFNDLYIVYACRLTLGEETFDE